MFFFLSLAFWCDVCEKHCWRLAFQTQLQGRGFGGEAQRQIRRGQRRRRRERRAPQRCEGLAFRGAAAVHEDVVGSAVGFLQPGGGGEEVIREVEIQGFRQTEAGKHQR